MHAAITPIQATRTYSVKPAQGLRYGNFDGVRNLPPIKQNENCKKQNITLLNNEQICRRVCQWVETWQPWQTRTLLCGIANRFSVNQLEILSTTLEPLRHRDFKTATLSRYPSASLKITNPALPKKKKKSNTSKSEKSASVKIPLVVTDSQGNVSTRNIVSHPNSAQNPVMKVIQKNKKKDIPSHQMDENNNSTEKNKLKFEEPEVCVRDEEEEKGEEKRNEKEEYVNDQGSHNSVDQLSSMLSASILKSAIEEASCVMIYDKQQFFNPKESSFEFGQSGDNTCLSDKDKQEPDVDNNGLTKMSEDRKHKRNENLPTEKTTPIDNDSELFESCRNSIFGKSHPKSCTSVSKSHPLSSRTSSAKFLGGVLEFATDLYQKHDMRAQSTSSRFRYSTFASSTVSTADFFDEQKISILGSMQHPAGPGSILKPIGVDLAPVSLQKCFKHSKWWPAQAPHGKTYQPAHRQELANNFKDQLQTIWGWLSDWEGYERISFLKEILKICSTDVLDALMTHIHQRLDDVRDVNRLPDQLVLYILSFLPSQDILQCAKVCRRWRYLCATDDLWVLKCLEIGEQAGIFNLEELIEEAKKSSMKIDWMWAHFELHKVADSMRLEWAVDNVDQLQDKLLKFDSSWTGVIKPIAGELVDFKVKREGKKEKGTVRIQLKTGVREKLEMAKLSRQVNSSSNVDGDDVGSDTDSAFSEEDLTHLTKEYDVMPEPSASRAAPQWSKSQRLTESFKLSVPEMVMEETTSGFTSGHRLTRSSGRSSTSSSKKKKEDEKDMALDIRTDLTQSYDILGKMKSYSSLEWETVDTYSDYMRTTLFAGELVGVKRMRKLQGHASAIKCVQFDRRRLVTCGTDRTVWLWDVRSGRSLHQFYGHKGGIRCLQFDNEIVATGSWDCLILVWDIKKFSKIATLQGHTDSVTCLRLTDDLLISGSDDHSVRLWRRPSFYCILTIPFDASIMSLIIVDHLVVVTTADLTTRMIDFYTGHVRRKFEPPLSPVQCLTAHGQLLIGGDAYGRVCFWHLTTGEMEAAVKVHDAAVNQVAYHSGRFFTASDDTTIKEWDLRTMTCLRVLKGHRGPVRDVQVSDRRIVSCSDDASVRIWDLVLDKAKIVQVQAKT